MPVKNMKDVKMTNEVNAVCLNLPIRKDIKDIIPLFKKNIKTAMSHLEPFSQLALFNIINSLPYDLYRWALDQVTDKTTLLYSNVNASKVPYVWDGKECTRLFYIANSVGTCNNIFTLVTMGSST